EPAPPSVAVARTASSNSLSEISNPKVLRGDLDNIILKALRKEPNRRYGSVAQFSDDVRRYLEGRPVTARKDTFNYRTVKFIKRNKRSEEHTSELQSLTNLVCRLLLEKKKKII